MLAEVSHPSTQQGAQPPAAMQQDKSPTPSPGRKLSSATVRADLVAHIRGLAESCGAVPDICKRRAPGEPDATAGVQVSDWAELRRRREMDLMNTYPAAGLHPSTFVPTSQVVPVGADAVGSAAAAAAAAAAAPLPMPLPMVPASGAAGGHMAVPGMPAMPAGASMLQLPSQSEPRGGGGGGGGGVRTVGKVTKANKSKQGGRTFTSKYRGVHQTFPTRRWEAQFRRNGKPTSLGCFDHEEQAARAYDKMMLWCELHNAAGVKGGITNFDPSAEYETEMGFLQNCTQDELVQMLRSDGRRQAAQRMLKQKKEGAALYQSAHADEDSD